MKKLILISLLLCLTGCWELEKGEKTGKIVKVAKAGYIFKTWDGELIRGGLNDGSGSMGRAFHFAIENEEVVEKLKLAMESQKQINIKYHQEAITFLRTNDDGDYFVDSVEIL
jgi:hypothetical protein